MSTIAVIIFALACGCIIVCVFTHNASSEDQPTPLTDAHKRMREQIKKEGYHV